MHLVFRQVPVGYKLREDEKLLGFVTPEQVANQQSTTNDGIL